VHGQKVRDFQVPYGVDNCEAHMSRTGLLFARRSYVFVRAPVCVCVRALRVRACVLLTWQDWRRLCVRAKHWENWENAKYRCANGLWVRGTWFGSEDYMSAEQLGQDTNVLMFSSSSSSSSRILRPPLDGPFFPLLGPPPRNWAAPRPFAALRTVIFSRAHLFCCCKMQLMHDHARDGAAGQA
jgi:hypothetical protein